MMHNLRIHKNAEKSLRKAPKHVREKSYRFLRHLQRNGTQDAPCRIKSLHGPFRKHKYLEAIIDKDYRIIFRKENGAFFIRMAGTHNELGTG